MPATLDQIAEAVGDIKKNMATRSEVIKLIDERVEEDKEKQAAEAKELADNTLSAVAELKKNQDEFAKQLRLSLRSHMSTIRTPAGMYNGCWGDLETARNFGLFCLASVYGNKKAAEQLESKGIPLARFTEDKEKAMGEDVSSTGGLLVPTEFIPNLILLIEKYGVFRRNALEYPMAADSAVAPKLTSGLTVYCPGAGVAPTLSDAAFKPVGMTAKKWMTLTALDSELDEDAAIAIGEIMGFLIGYAFAKKEDEVGFLGDGTSTYFGHVGITGALRAVDATIANIKSLFVGTGDLYSELVLADFETLMGTLPEYAEDDAKWYCSKYFFFTVMARLALAAGGVNATEIQMNRLAKQRFWMGYPVEVTQAMPKVAAASQICAVLGNLKLGAYMGDRRKLTIDRSTEAYFTTDQIGFRGTERVAPTIHGVGDTTDAGPICALITKAS